MKYLKEILIKLKDIMLLLLAFIGMAATVVYEKYLTKWYEKLKEYFYIPQAPVGLNAMGVRGNYLNKIYRCNYSRNRFCSDIISPVDDPYLINPAEL